MNIHTLSDNVLVKQSIPPQTVTDDVEGTGVDCLGYEGLLVIVDVGNIPTGNTLTVKLQESSDDGVADAYADITGATTGALAPANDDEPYLIELNLSERERYVRAFASETGATPIVGVEFVLFRARRLVPSQDNTVVQVGFARA